MVKPLSLSEKLHLVIPIYAEDNETIHAYVHSAPISSEVFEAHFLLISKTFAAIHAEGLGNVAGPRVASLILNKVAERIGDPSNAIALMNEVRRLTNVLMRTDRGWETYAFQDVTDGRLLDEEDLNEVINSVVFFTAAYVMHQRKNRKAFLVGAAIIWGAQISPLDFTAFVASQRTSAAVEHFPLQAASSVAY